MKILVFSDSHGAEQPMIDAFNENKDVETIVFLGDGERDFEGFLASCGIAPYGPNDRVKTIQVRGNCDRMSLEPVTVTVELGGVRALITHGHEQNVKFGYARLLQEARNRNCRIALFGHTHLPCAEEKDGILLLNPGSVRAGKYAVLKTGGHQTEYDLKDLR